MSLWRSKFFDFIMEHPVKSYKKGEIIIFQGEAPRQAFIVISGVVKAYNLSLNGDEKPVAFYTELDLFPGPWIFSLVASSTYYYETFTKNVKLAVVDKAKLLDFIKSDERLLFSMLERQIKIQLSQSMHLNALQYSRASDKLIYTLHFLALNMGKKKGSKQLELGISLTHQDLANLTGLTRETTAMELNKMKRLGIIDYGPHKPYTLHLDKLSSLANDQYISALNEAI